MKRLIERMVLLLCAVLLIGALAATASAAEVASGTCGENVTWVLDDQGTLTISGTGDMWDFDTAGDVPWNNLKKINEVVIQYGVSSIADYAFYGKTRITNVTIPDTVTSIGAHSFYSCENLTGITIPDSVTSIGQGAFASCYRLINVTIPDGVTCIDEYAFCECVNLTSITIPDSVTRIGDLAFFGCSSLSSIRIPDFVTGIGYAAFLGCESLTSINIPDGITSIPDSAFAGCYNLTGITIPDSVTSIGTAAFDGCGSLPSINIPDSVTIIGDSAFSTCSSLTSVTLPDSVTSIGTGAFLCCHSLASINIPDGIKTISPHTFAKCFELTSITIPDSVTSIGENAFFECISLTSITIPDGVTSIADHTFDNCIGLTSIRIPKDVTGIGQAAFTGCIGLTSITIPDNVSRMDRYAFSYCTSLKSITFNGDAPYIFDDTFGNVTATAYYPANNSTWTSDVRQNYGGNLTWVVKGMETQITAPTLKASNVASTGKIKLSWDKVDGAAKYQIVRSLDNKNWEHLAYSTGTSATNTKTDAGKTYYYKIRAIDANGNKSKYSNVVSRTCDLPQPTVTVTNVASTGKIKLSWNKIEGAAKYQIVRSLDNKTWEHLAYSTGTSATNTKVDAGKTYYYKVRAVHSVSAATSAYSSVVSRTCDLPQVTGLKATNVASTGKIKLSWNKVDGAAKYQIVRSLDNKNWEHLSYTTGTSATNTKTDAGKTYYYKVRAVHSDSAATSAYSAVVSRTCDLAQPTLTVKLNSNGKPTLSWTKVTGAVKYQIVRSTDNKNWEHLTYTTNTSATNTKAVAGTKYYYKIRAIHSNTDANSAYSAVKYITAK